MNSQPRLTLGQMAAGAVQANGDDPWACPRCGCRDWRVADSRFTGNERKRQRVCRHCNAPLMTVEIPCPPGHKLVAVPDGPQDS